MPDVTAAEAILIAGQIDQTYAIGNGTNFQVGTHGTTWSTNVKRYARRIQANAGGGGGYYRLNEQADPRALVDPRYGQIPNILTARECLALAYPNGMVINASNHMAQAWWGFGGMPNALSTGSGNYFPFVGFYVRYESALSGATLWQLKVVNDALTTVYNVTTAVDSRDPHEFQLLLDGRDNTIYFYIDGVSEGSYAPASNAAPGQQNPYPTVLTAAGAWNLLYAHNNVGPATFLSDFLYHMSPATPLITLQSADV